MKKKIGFVLNTLGWLMLIFAMLMAGIRNVGLNPQLYFDLQMKAEILNEAGISEQDLRMLDTALANYLGGTQTMMDYELEVFGKMQPAFNVREIEHLADCRTLLSPATTVWFNAALAIIGAALVFLGWKAGWKVVQPLWIASAVITLPLGIFALWAAVDFSSAFVFFHRLLFTNDLWMLNPQTDLLIRICPQSMFANMGLRIALLSATVLLGLPLVVTVLHLIFKKRKKDTNEIPQI